MKIFSSSNLLSEQPTYVSILGLYSFAGLFITYTFYSFNAHRILGNTVFYMLQAINVYNLYIWTVLFLDDMLWLFKKFDKAKKMMPYIKEVGIVVLAVCAITASAFTINSKRLEDSELHKSNVLDIKTLGVGAMSFDYFVLSPLDGKADGKLYVIKNKMDDELYVGQEVLVRESRGLLGLREVLQVKENSEVYYGNMKTVLPDSFKAREGLISVYMDQKEYHKAERMYLEYLRMSPPQDNIGEYLASRLIMEEQYDIACRIYEHMLKSERNYDTLTQYGYALAYSLRYAEAVKIYEEAIMLDPDNYIAHYHLGYVFRDMKRYDDARASWTRTLELFPNFPEVKKRLTELQR